MVVAPFAVARISRAAPIIPLKNGTGAGARSPSQLTTTKSEVRSPGSSVERIGGDAGDELGRRRIESQDGAARLAVEPLVIENDVMIFADLRRGRAAPRAADAAHFENIGKVAGKGHRQPQRHLRLAVIADAEALIDGPAPEEKCAHDVQRVFRQNQALVEINVRIGEIDGEHRIVVAHIRAEQQKLHAVEQKLEDATESAYRRERVRQARRHSRRCRRGCPTTTKVSSCLSVRRGRVAGPVAGM